MILGSAPLAGNVLTFVRCALGCIIVEGYGQTECTAPITLTIHGDSIPEHVGPPVACCCVKVLRFHLFPAFYMLKISETLYFPHFICSMSFTVSRCT